MKQRDRIKTEGTITIRVMCALLFLLFTFCWLYFFQGDMLAVAQHGLSGGKTHYDVTIGALIITAVLFVLHLLVYAFTRLSRASHALTYLPSFLLLAFVSTVSYPFRWGAWLWAGPLVLILWGLTAWLARKLPPLVGIGRDNGLFSRCAWINYLLMAVMMMIVTGLSNTNGVAHHTAHAESALMRGDTDEALRAGEKSLETDENLTMLRVLALSQRGELGDRLFEYALAGSSADLLPLRESHSRLMLMADTIVWDFFGLRPDSIRQYGAQVLNVSQYLDSLACDTTHILTADSSATVPLVNKAALRDYRLAGQLIDRQIDAFVLSLPDHYALDADSLPRHYREALVLYQQRRDTLFAYSDSLMLLRWHDFCRYDSLYPQKSERRIRSEEDFRGTYWYYFFEK